MPFTFSHPAAVLPSNYLPKHWLSLTGLVVGSIVPDFEYFIRMRVLSIYSHTWLGLFWFDIPLGLIIMLIYDNLIKNKLIDHLPLFLNQRFSAFKNSLTTHKYPFAIIIISLFIGAASHILWDSFTHPTGYFVLQIHQLNHRFVIFHHSIAFYNILQQLSSIAGATVILIVTMKLPKGVVTSDKNIGLYWGLVAGVFAVTLGVRLFTGLKISDVGDLLVTCISGFLIGLTITSCLVRKPRSIEGFA